MAVRMLSAGRMKVTLLTAKPADPMKPTVTELAAGIEICKNIPAGAFTFAASGSEAVDATSLCSETKAEIFGQGNYELTFGLWRQFAPGTGGVAGGIDTVGDAAFEALKIKGATFYLYARFTDKKATEAWAVDDEIFLGAEAVTDTPSPMSASEGFIGYNIPAKVQDGWPFIKVLAGT